MCLLSKIHMFDTSGLTPLYVLLTFLDNIVQPHTVHREMV